MTDDKATLKELEAQKERERASTTGESPSPPPFSPAPSYHSSREGDAREDDKTETDQISELDIATDEIPPDKPSVEYGIYYTKSHTHMIICSAATANKPPLYFAEVSEFTWRKTDVQLHRVPAEIADNTPDGSDLKTKQGVRGPVVGIANFPTLSRDFHVGFGNPDDPNETIVWEDIKNASRVQHGRYDFFYTNPYEGLFAKPVKYSWRRTHSEEHVEGAKWNRKMNMNCWKLIDLRTNQIIALVTANLFKKWAKAGKMLIFDGREKELELMIMLTFSAIAEKARRREWKRRVAAAGGGGGGGGGGG